LGTLTRSVLKLSWSSTAEYRIMGIFVGCKITIPKGNVCNRAFPPTQCRSFLSVNSTVRCAQLWDRADVQPLYKLEHSIASDTQCIPMPRASTVRPLRQHVWCSGASTLTDRSGGKPEFVNSHDLYRSDGKMMKKKKRCADFE